MYGGNEKCMEDVSRKTSVKENLEDIVVDAERKRFKKNRI
jgi:hypothetical protein